MCSTAVSATYIFNSVFFCCVNKKYRNMENKLKLFTKQNILKIVLFPPRYNFFERPDSGTTTQTSSNFSSQKITQKPENTHLIRIYSMTHLQRILS